jgi:subtilisin-like proprotein convertase family protein
MKSTYSLKTAPKLVLTLVLLGACALIAFPAYFPAPTTARPEDGAAAVDAAWRRANDIGSYHYTTEIEQTTWPLPKLENVGLGSTTERFYIEGQIDAVAESMTMKVWSGGGSALTGDNGFEIRIADGKAMGRVGKDGWREVDDFTGLFAPDRDPLAYLAGAEDIRQVGTETRAGVTFDRYAFRLDGPSFAVYMRDQMEEELLRKGELPAGLRLDMVRVYVEMKGEGEVWLDSDGLPLRQTLHASFPPDHRERTEVQITTDFSHFQTGPSYAAAGGRAGGLVSSATARLARLSPQDLVQASTNLGLFGLCVALAAVLVLQQNSRRVYATTVVVVAVSLLITPLLQSQHVYAFSQKQAAARAQNERQQEAARQASELEASLLVDEKSFDPRRDPLVNPRARTSTGLPAPLGDTRPTSSLPRVAAAGTECDLENDPGTDSDGDNLTDMQEDCIGTDKDDEDTDNDKLNDDIEVFELGTNPTEPDGQDTDGDTIRDGVEVVGFEDDAGERWFLNPLDPDTNGDGIPDEVELPVKRNGKLDCTDTDGDSIPNCDIDDVDTDADGTPDVFDFDDDGDGVPDRIDLARTLAAGTVEGDEIAGLDGGSFRFELDDLTLDTPVYVDFQIRPVNPDHLWYTLNVLDWPSDDREGQVQRVHDTTFGDTGKEANGDMRLIPMLEIEIPYERGHYGHLPVKPGAPAIKPSTPITAWLDAGELAALNVTVRKTDDAGTLAAYVPLVLVKDPAGDGPVAFAGRMFYRPSVDSAGPAQEARLVWVIQAKTDHCAPVSDDFMPEASAADRYEAWCKGKENWVESETVIHTYYDDWYLTGFSVREDRGLKAGIIFENPDYALSQGYDPDTYYEAYLWGLAANLDQTFIAGRGEDTDGDGTPDTRDLTLDDIWTRFHTGNDASAEERWDIPKNALQVITYTFPHQSYISHIPMTHTQEILDGYFMDGGTPKIENPTMLFVREETVRTVALDAGDAVVQHAATIQNGVLKTNQVKVVLDPAEVPEAVLAGLNWAPYKYAGADVWESDPVDEYVAKLKGRLRPLFEADPDLNPDRYTIDEIASILDGAEIVAGSFYLTLFAGLSNVVEMEGFSLSLSYAKEDVDVWFTGAKIGGSIAKAVVLEIASQVADAGRWTSLGRTLMDAKWFTRFFGTGAADESLAMLLQAGGQSGGVTGLIRRVWKGQVLGKAGAPLLVVGAVAAVGLVAYIAIALALGIPGTEYVIQGISLAISLGLLGKAIKDIYTAVHAVSSGGWKMIKSLSNTVTRAALVAAVVGMVITAVVAVGFFVYSMVAGGIQFGSLAFDEAFANMIATIIVAAIMIAIGMIPLIGPLIVAIIGAIDALIISACMIVEAATDVENESWWVLVKDYGCGGITGVMTKLVETFIYDQTPLIDLQAPDRMIPTNFQVDVSPLAQGMAVGGDLTIGADVTTALYRNAPLEPDQWEREIDALIEDGDFEALQRLIDDFGVGIFYIWQFADPFINDATFRYALVTTDTETIDVGIKQMEDEWLPASTGVFDSKRYTTTQVVNNGGNITFVEPGLNWQPELYLAESYAMQAQECTGLPPGTPVNPTLIPIIVCWLRPTEDTTHVPLGDRFQFDVFPATLDGFYTLASMGDRSYALAWDSRFPVLADADGDGLRSQAKGGNDPDDRFPDTDLDGLSDFYEVQHGLNASVPDIDGDGWNDYQEVLHGTNPARADSDSDGLLDKEEVDGWEYVYGFDTLDQPLITRVTSDPQVPDTDGDGITDKLEQTYGFNPRVYSEPNILSIESQISAPECGQIVITGVGVLQMLDDLPGVSDGELGILLDGEQIWYQEGAQLGNVYAPDVVEELCGSSVPLQLVEYDSSSGDDDLGTVYLDGGVTGDFAHTFTDGVVIVQLNWTVFAPARSGRFVAPGQTVAYTATVENHLRDRYALGLLEVDFPVVGQVGAVEPLPYTLPPATETTLDGYLTVQPGVVESQYISLTHRAGASMANLRGEAGGRVLWLRFNENADATRFVDNSLLGHDGTCTGSTCPTAGEPGYAGLAVDFDGVDDYVTLGNPDRMNFEGAITLAAWIKPRASDGFRSILTHGYSGSEGKQVFFHINDGEYQVGFWDNGDTARASYPVPAGDLGTWIHLAGTYDGTTWRLYRNGAQVAEQADDTGAIVVDQNWFVGARDHGPDRFFDGLIDDVEILPVALSPAEIVTRVREPVFHAKFDETDYDCPTDESGECRLDDSSANQNDISCPQRCMSLFDYTFCDNPRCPSLGTNSPLGSGIEFNQETHLLAGPSDSLDLSQGAGNFSLAAWLRPEDYTEYISPDNKDGDADWEGWYAVFGSNTYPTLYVDKTGKRLGLRLSTTAGACGFKTTSNVLSLSRWNHVMVTFDGTLLTLYVDGEPVDPAAYTQGECSGRTLRSATSFNIGRRNKNGYIYFDRVCVYDEGDGSLQPTGELELYFDGSSIWGPRDVQGQDDYCSYYDILKSEKVTDDDYHDVILYEVDKSTADEINVSKSIYNIDIGEREDSWDDSIDPAADGRGYLEWAIDNDFYRGRLDDLRIYRYAFSEDEVQDLYLGTERALEIRFDEAPGRDVFYDYSGAGFNGTCDQSAGTCPDSGFPGRANQAARFDGIDDLVQTTFVNDLPVDDFTMAVWFKTGSSENQKILYSSSNNRPLVVRNRVLRTCIAGQCADGTTHVDDGQWHFVAVVGDSSGVEMYLDGNTSPEATLPALSGNMSGRLRIGQDNSGANFDGLIDQVTVFRKPLSTGEIADLIAEAPIINLHLDDPVGVTTFDDAANPGVSPSCMITPALMTDCGCPASGADGWMRRGVVFEGISYPNDAAQCISIPSSSAPDSFTVGGWFKPTRRRGVDQVLIHKQDAFDLSIPLNTMKVQFNIAQTAQADGATPQDNPISQDLLIPNQWNHVMATYDQGKLSIYVNGSSAFSGEITWSPQSTSAPIHVGNNFAGMADEVVVYDNALSDRDVKSLYDYQVTWYDTSFSHSVTIDADDPYVRLDFAGSYIPKQPGLVMAIVATDTTSLVEQVEYRVSGDVWREAQRDVDVWAFAITPTVAGPLTIGARATDSAGNQAQISRTLTVDDMGPAVALDAIFTTDTLGAEVDLRLTGTATDDASGVERVTVTLLDANGIAVAGPQMAQSTDGGLVHLPLDETAGSTLFDDVSGYDNDGTCSGGACPTAGQPGYVGRAADFDGATDYIDLGNPAGLNFEGQITLAAWIYPRASGGFRSILTHGRDDANRQVFFHINDGEYEAGFWDAGVTARASYDMPPGDLNAWVHLAGTYDGAAWRLYRNGVQVDEQAASTGAITVSQSWFVGARDRDSVKERFFDGLIDDVRIYNRALSSVEVGALYSAPAVPANGWLADLTLTFPLNGQYTLLLEAVDGVGNATSSELMTRAPTLQSPVLELDGTPPFADLTDVGDTPFALTGVEAGRPTLTGTVSEVPYPTDRALHVHFEEAAGATEFHDGSLYHTVGTCSGGACPAAGESGHLGSAARFDGGDQVNLGWNMRLGQLTQDFSVMAWVNLASTAGQQQIIAADTVSSTNGFGFGIDGGGLQLDTYGVKTYDTTSVALNAGQWTHVAAVMEWVDATDLAVTFYVDGLAQEAITHTAPGLVDEDDDWLIGLGLNGLLDELLLYDRALTPAQIQAIARPGVSGIASGELGLLHVKDRGGPTGPVYEPISLTHHGDAFATWNHQLAAGIEGPYEIYLQSTDGLSLTRTQPNVWQGEIDTQAPRAVLTHYTPRFPGDWDIYRCWAEDYNLAAADYACPVPNSQPEYQDADWYSAVFSQTKLYRYTSPATPVSTASPSDALTACDVYSACTTVTRTTESVVWPLGVVILTPTTHSVFTALAPIEVGGAAYGLNTLDNLTVTASGATIYTHTSIAAQTLSWTVSPAWTPPSEGVYTLVATVEDQDTDVITSGAPISDTPGLTTIVYVDTTAPGIEITTDRVSRENFDSNGYVQVTGLVTETTGIQRLQARLESSAGSAQEDAWQHVPVSGSYPLAGAPWNAVLYSGSPIPPSGQTYTLTARVTDVASRTVEVSRTIWADAVPPDGFGVTLAYTDSQGLRQTVSPGATIYDAQTLSPTLIVTWTASSDEGGLGPYHVEWIEHLPSTSPVQRSTDVVTPRSDSFGAGEAQKLSVEVSAHDLYDNRTLQALGPVYVDYEETPAYIGTDASGHLATPVYRGWLEAPCNLLGTDTRAADRAGSSGSDPQELYGTWNEDGLRITWTGANWGGAGGVDADGDMFIYLDTQAGGTVSAHDPYTTTGSPVLLPAYRVGTTMQRMAADYLVWVRDSADARLMKWNDVDGEWQTSSGDWDYVFGPNLSTPTTDLYIPFSTLSIADPVSTSLSLVAFATEEGRLALWATMPPDNPVNSARAVDSPPESGSDLILTHRYGWPTLGPGVCPKNGRFAGPHVRVSLSAEPAGIPYSLLGNDLPDPTADTLAAMIGWDVLQREPCLSHPETPTCTWMIDTASKVAFDGQIELAHAMNVDAPALGNGRQVTYTLHMANDGSAQAVDVQAHVDTWGHLRLPGGAIQTTPVTLTVGEEYTHTFTTEIDTSHDPTHDNGWGTLEVVVFDDTSVYTAPNSYEYPLDWIYLDHEIDQTGPEYVEIQRPPGLIKPDLNTLGGFVYDQSAVPTVTLEVKDPLAAVATFVCPDSTPEDGQWSCQVDVGAAQEGARFEVRAMATDVYGQASVWFPWKPFIVDSRPPSVTLSNATIAALSDGWIGGAETTFKGKVTDDRLVGGVEVCDPAAGPTSCKAGEIVRYVDAPPVSMYEYDDDPGTGLAVGGCASALSVPITVTDSFTVTDVDVGLNLDHPRRKDIQATLYAPSGISVTLIHVGTGAANYDVLLDDGAAVPLWKDAVNHTTAAPTYENQRRSYDLLNGFEGQAAQGTWHLVLCDTDPGEEDGTYNRSRLILTADTLPISTTAKWRYTLPATTADGVEQSRTVYGIDSVENRSTEPLSLTYRLDTVPPVITVRDNLASTSVFTISGFISDGGEVGPMSILILKPNGTFWGAPIQHDGATWAYEYHFTQVGAYLIWIMAEDKAGNGSVVGPFVPGEDVERRTYLPLVMRNDGGG